MQKYLYNGMNAPNLDTVWTDKETYPYALMYKDGDGVILVCLSGASWVYEASDSGSEAFRSSMFETGIEHPYAWFEYSSGGTEWVKSYYGTNKPSAGDATFIIVSANADRPTMWTSHDIYDLNGTMVLEASDPIPVTAPTLDPLSLFMGWKAGNWVLRQRGKKKQPVSYLYNGVQLPGLPEWDKVNNPCAAIMRIEIEGIAHALLAVAQYVDSRFAIRHNKNGDPVVMAKVSGYYVGINSFNCIAMFYAPLSGGEWVATADSFSCNAEDLIWSNFDVADARTDDGTVFLAASTPVPVYE